MKNINIGDRVLVGSTSALSVRGQVVNFDGDGDPIVRYDDGHEGPCYWDEVQKATRDPVDN